MSNLSMSIFSVNKSIIQRKYSRGTKNKSRYEGQIRIEVVNVRVGYGKAAAAVGKREQISNP